MNILNERKLLKTQLNSDFNKKTQMVNDPDL